MHTLVPPCCETLDYHSLGHLLVKINEKVNSLFLHGIPITARSAFIGDEPPVPTVAFNPILMALPTNASTIYTTLRRTKEMFNT